MNETAKRVIQVVPSTDFLSSTLHGVKPTYALQNNSNTIQDRYIYFTPAKNQNSNAPTETGIRHNTTNNCASAKERKQKPSRRISVDQITGNGLVYIYIHM